VKRGVFFAAALALVPVSPSARAELVRGTIKIDVRDGRGQTREAKVTVQPEAGGEPKPVGRSGEVYVADELLDGNWVVAVEGAPPVTVRVRGRHTVGAVIVFGDKPARGRHAPPPYTVGPNDPVCEDEGGVVVEAVAFQSGALGAGRLDVKTWEGKPLCSATFAGGGATLKLKPGKYLVDARFVGGKTARLHYQLPDGRTPPPLTLTVK
jgi:hypothetical protein